MKVFSIFLGKAIILIPLALMFVTIIQISYGSSHTKTLQNGIATENKSYRDKVGDEPSEIWLNIELTQCAFFCLTGQCRFFFYYEDMQICNLHNGSAGFYGSFLNDAGWRFFNMKESCPFSYHYNAMLSSCFQLYHAGSVFTTYELKRGKCISDGGSVVKVDSLEKQLAVEDYLRLGGASESKYNFGLKHHRREFSISKHLSGESKLILIYCSRSKELDFSNFYVESAMATMSEAATGFTSYLVMIQGQRSPSFGPWFFDDGSPLLYTNWDGPGSQPDNYERYIGMSLNDDYRWHDIDASVPESMFLCEIIV